MSYQAVSWALYDAPHLLTDKGLPDTTARGVLVVLAEHANDEGANAHPSPLRVRYATGYDVRTIDRALGRLEAGELIERTGVTKSGTTIWRLSMHITRPADEWDNLRADAEDAKRDESAKRKARRDRRRSMHSDDVRDAESRMSGTENPDVRDAESRMSGTENPDVRDAESRMSGTENPDVRDAESRMSGTQRPPNHHKEPPRRTTPGTTPGGAPPPDPRGDDEPSVRRTENQNSLYLVTHMAQDQEGDHRPRARVNNPERLPPQPEPRVNNHGSPIGDVTFLAAQPRETAEVITLTDAMREPCPHGRSPRRRRDGTPRCPLCATQAPTQPDTTETTPQPVQLGRSCPNHPGLAAGNRPDGQPRCPICRRLPQERPHAAT